MSLHRQTTHPQPVDGCFGCKVSTLAFNTSEAAQAQVASERNLRKDLDAYKRLRRDGMQPRSIYGTHALERDAKSKFEVEHGITPTRVTDAHVREAAEVSKALGLPS